MLPQNEAHQSWKHVESKCCCCLLEILDRNWDKAISLFCRLNCSSFASWKPELRSIHTPTLTTPQRDASLVFCLGMCVCVCVPVCVSGQSHQCKQRKMDKQWQSKHCGQQEGKGERQGGAGRDGWRVWRDNKVTGVTRGIGSERERNERRGQMMEKTGQLRSYELTKLIANKKRGKRAIEEGN